MPGEFASRVLDVAEAIPPGRVMSYGAIAEYLGTSDAFDQSITDFSERYADQNEQDYNAFVEAMDAVRAGVSVTARKHWRIASCPVIWATCRPMCAKAA